MVISDSEPVIEVQDLDHEQISAPEEHPAKEQVYTCTCSMLK